MQAGIDAASCHTTCRLKNLGKSMTYGQYMRLNDSRFENHKRTALHSVQRSDIRIHERGGVREVTGSSAQPSESLLQPSS